MKVIRLVQIRSRMRLKGVPSVLGRRQRLISRTPLSSMPHRQRDDHTIRGCSRVLVVPDLPRGLAGVAFVATSRN